MARVLLINMPFSSLQWPALGLSLLKAGLAQAHVPCAIAYLQFDLAETIGLERYQWINDAFGFVLGGERLFANELFAGRLPDDDQYFRNVLLPVDPSLSDQDRADFFDAGHHIRPFLDRVFQRIDWTRYSIVGFTTTFQQTLASLALACRIKRHHPRIHVIFGGANCEGSMGRQLLQSFPFVDIVFSGEADATFPAVVSELIEHGRIRQLPGVFARKRLLRTTVPRSPAFSERDGDTVVPGRNAREQLDGKPVLDLDRLPYPDFTDYFDRLNASPLHDRIEPLLLFEGSRGCWWGAKRQCAFCGLNGTTLRFRAKSASRVLDELHALQQRYGVHRICATDNIMDFRYFKSLLPLLRDARLGIELEYELKANLRRDQVGLLVAAGLAAAQLGIESLATPVLKQMRKGTTAPRNLQTLKWFTEAGIAVRWNLLYGFPGESAREYANMAHLIDSLVHLAPPQAVGRIRIDRFSPYFDAPRLFGIGALEPVDAYRYVYPLSPDEISSLAYFFHESAADTAQVPDYVHPVLEAVERWQQVFAGATLRQHEQGDDTLVLLDTRPQAVRFQRRLRGIQRAVYDFCDRSRTWPAICRHIAQLFPEGEWDEPALHRMLEEWVEDRIMAKVDRTYLSLALNDAK